jgi:hypothetical protein
MKEIQKLNETYNGQGELGKAIAQMLTEISNKIDEIVERQNELDKQLNGTIITMLTKK